MQILSDLWKDLETDSYRLDESKKNAEICEALVSDDDSKNFAGREYAEDAIVSLFYAIQSKLTGRSQEAVWAAGRVHDAVDKHVVHLLGIEILFPGEDARLDAHPLIQAEFRRQRADLADLRSAAKNPGSERAIIARIRRRVESDAVHLFGPNGGR
jgi:hypothetical protein